ncbi:MAG: hypothetical protein LCH34_12840 [Firmicutes bacterium]|nr:hypothetical protein [Bacillota bacterium]
MSDKTMEMMKKILEKKKEQQQQHGSVRPDKGKGVSSKPKKHQKPGGSNNKV